jgi:hypothetical protein
MKGRGEDPFFAGRWAEADPHPDMKDMKGNDQENDRIQLINSVPLRSKKSCGYGECVSSTLLSLCLNKKELSESSFFHLTLFPSLISRAFASIRISYGN